jgi:hypothetical protein
MKKLFFFLMAGIVLSSFLVAFSPGNDPKPAKPATTNYIVIAWNDLGMHCANLDFSNLCILPPYNNQYAHVINVGDNTTMPTVLSTAAGVYCTYEIPGNTYSAGKTNFWDYSFHLFGVTLPLNIGLTGVGLTGNMIDTLNYHFVEGIPITAYPDNSLTVPDPYQLTLIKAYNSGNEVIATTQSVIPVAHEINCVSSGCHPNEMDINRCRDSTSPTNRSCAQTAMRTMPSACPARREPRLSPRSFTKNTAARPTTVTNAIRDRTPSASGMSCMREEWSARIATGPYPTLETRSRTDGSPG